MKATSSSNAARVGRTVANGRRSAAVIANVTVRAVNGNASRVIAGFDVELSVSNAPLPGIGIAREEKHRRRHCGSGQRYNEKSPIDAVHFPLLFPMPRSCRGASKNGRRALRRQTSALRPP
jgi:hypothetical protein